MNSIILTMFENRCPLNRFNSLVFRKMKISMPKIDKFSMNIMYYGILQVHPISYAIETCSWLLNILTSCVDIIYTYLLL